MIVARHLTIPLLHQGSYHRRLVLFNLPCSLALLTVVMTTHILKGTPTDIGGFPVAAIAAILGAVLAIPMHLWWLPIKNRGGAGQDERVGLLGSAPASSSAASSEGGAKAESGGKADAGGHGGHGGVPHWYDKVVDAVLGPEGDPMPKGFVFTFYLILSFGMSLIWLLLIANELVGTALCFGKILNVPDIVMGLVVLAVG